MRNSIRLGPGTRLKTLALSSLLAFAPALAAEAKATNAHPSGKLLAQTETTAEQPAAGSITPDKIRSVVEITLRQKWQPIKGPEGSASEVQFQVSTSGQIEGVSLVNSAGNAEFDRACLEAIQKTAPLPALPPYLGLNQLPFGATFHSGNQPWVELRLLEDNKGKPNPQGNQSGLMQPSSTALQAASGSINDLSGSIPPQSDGSNSSPAQPSRAQPATQGEAGTSTVDINQRVLTLNNQAVVAINDSNYEFAIKKLEEALKLDPTYKHARENLAIAYNNYGLQLTSRPHEALNVFHKAFALDPANAKTKTNLETIIQYLGKNPKSFKDRLDLGNKSLSAGDLIGARIEFEAAMAIKPDPIVQQKLQQLLSGNVPHRTAGQGQSAQNQQNGKTPPLHTKSPSPGKGGTTDSASKPPSNNSGKGTITTGGATQLDTMYRNVKSLEVKTFGKTFESDDILTRLSRLETKLLGKTQSGKPMRRLDALLLLQ